jgi:hypothetical protein
VTRHWHAGVQHKAEPPNPLSVSVYASAPAHPGADVSDPRVTLIMTDDVASHRVTIRWARGPEAVLDERNVQTQELQQLISAFDHRRAAHLD